MAPPAGPALCSPLRRSMAAPGLFAALRASLSLHAPHQLLAGSVGKVARLASHRGMKPTCF